MNQHTAPEAVVSQASGQAEAGASPPCVVSRRRVITRMGGAALVLALALGLVGCGDATSRRADYDEVLPPNREQSDALFDYAIGLLDDLDQYNDFNNSQARKQIVGRLNQWLQLDEVAGDWRPDPLLSTLPEGFQRLPIVRRLGDLHFAPPDGTLLREAIWLRDVARTARGQAVDEVDKARALFDWTVRNIQLDAAAPVESRPVFLPWQTLLFGHGLPEDRAWVFVLLARQQGLDVVMLALPDKASPKGYRPWIPALLSHGELYLFDPELGLPLPTSTGDGVGTLSEIATDDGLLRRLDLDEHPYPIRAGDLSGVIALVEASPAYLSRRMELIESRLAGEHALVLSVDASGLAEKLRASPHVSDVRLWLLPYERIAEQVNPTREQTQAIIREAIPFQVGDATLWKARVLHLMGHLTGKASANTLYLASRPAEADIARAKLDPAKKEILKLRKQDASYWLGLVAFERGKYETAIGHFEKRTLADWPHGRWTAGARFNLARAFEATGRLDRAAELYAADTSPQWHGNHLRARWLERSKPAGSQPR